MGWIFIYNTICIDNLNFRCMVKPIFCNALRGMLFMIASLLMLSPGVQAQQSPTDPLPIDPQVRTGKLSNGLTYYIRRNVKPEKKVELRLAVNAGSILEEDDQQGLAHFTEHMAFNGSSHFKKNDIVSFLQSIGVKFGADLNAYTGFDETVYILPIPTEKKENVEKAFQILEDWASTIAFEGAEIDKERGVVLEESRLGKGAEDRMFRVVYPKMFQGSKYASRLPIGKDDVLKNFAHDAIRRFYRDWYRPDLMAVAVVGDIDVNEMEQMIKKHFEKLKNPAKTRARAQESVPARTQSEGLVVTDKEATNHVLNIYYPYQVAKSTTTFADYRTSVVRRLFTSMLAQRIQELTQKADPPFIFGGNFIGGYARGYEAYQSAAYLSKAGIEAAVKALVQENERARKFGFTAAELERTKKTVLKSMERLYNEREKTESSSLVDEYVRHFLEKEPIPGIENEYKYYSTMLEGITLDEVNQHAAKTIPAPGEKKLVVLTGPEKADFAIPTGDALLAMVEQAAAADITAYTEKAVATSLLDKTPVAGKITGEKTNAALGTTELTLSNGIKVILKPSDFKNDQVVFSATRFGGQYLFDVKDRTNALFAANVVGQMGVGNFSPNDLRKVLAGKNASVSPRLSNIAEGLNGQSSTADVESLMQLIYLYFTQPRLDQELFKSFVSKQQAMYQNMTANPQFIYQDTLVRTLYKNHPWAPRVSTPEMFGQIDVNRALAIYKERFGDAHDFTFVFVGKFDINAIKPYIATYLASLPATTKKSTFKDVGLRATSGPLVKEVKKGTEPKSFITLLWNGEATFSDNENLKMQALSEVLNIKIIESLREDMGGIYGGGVYAQLSKNPYGSYSVGVSLPCGPENVDKLIKAAFAEIDKVRTNGPTADDLAKVKETWKQQYLVNIKDNNYWLRQLIQSVENGTDAAQILTYEKRIEALTAKDVQDAAKKYMDTGKCVQIILNPEK